MAPHDITDQSCALCPYAGITAFPRGLGELRDLEGLQADGCPLAAPYSTLYAKNPLLLVALHDRERLAVDFTDCGLDSVPADLLQQTQLTSLNLSKNNIQELPVGLGQLRRLRQLSIKGNPLQQPYLKCVYPIVIACIKFCQPTVAAGTVGTGSREAALVLASMLQAAVARVECVLARTAGSLMLVGSWLCWHSCAQKGRAAYWTCQRVPLRTCPASSGSCQDAHLLCRSCTYPTTDCAPSQR